MATILLFARKLSYFDAVRLANQGTTTKKRPVFSGSFLCAVSSWRGKNVIERFKAWIIRQRNFVSHRRGHDRHDGQACRRHVPNT